MKNSSLFGLVTSVVLAGASAAHATCYVSLNNGGEMFGMPLNSCLFMGTQEDFATWGAESCSGVAEVFVQPQYNDRIVSIMHSAGGRMTLMENVMRDGNGVTFDMARGQVIDLDARWREAATVLLCQ